MTRRAFKAGSVACVLACLSLSLSLSLSISVRAEAAGAWLSTTALTPVEQRVAVAIGPSRTTMWTSLRFTSGPGVVGIVVPAPPGASLDLASDAWFEALEVATAPRVFAPIGVNPYCPSTAGPPSPFEIAGQVAHVASLPLQDVAVLDDAAAVEGWAKQAGLAVSKDLASALAALTGTRFVAMRFESKGGPAITPALRVAMPGAPPMLPLALTSAGSAPLHVTSWFLGEGRAEVVGSAKTAIPPPKLRWLAKAGASNYDEERQIALAAQSGDGTLAECASHAALVQNLPVANGTASIDGLVTTYFERAAAYGDTGTGIDPSACTQKAAITLGSSVPFPTTCARADLGVVEDGGAACSEAPGGSGNDVRCGGQSDDLAVALSGLTPAKVWLTRQASLIPASTLGADWGVTVAPGAEMVPVRHATSVVLTGCDSLSSTTASASSGSGSGSGPSGGAGWTPSDPPVQSTQDGTGGSRGSTASDVANAVDTLVQSGSCDCSGTADTSGSAADSSCSGSSDGSTGSADACSSSSSSSSSGSSDTCSSSSGSSSDACSGSSSGSGSFDCSGGSGSSGSCAVGGQGARRRSPRFSVLVLGAIALLAPLRRLGRRDRLSA